MRSVPAPRSLVSFTSCWGIPEEHMVDEYHNYWFHIKGFFIGEGLALVVCALAGLVVQFVL